MDRRTLLKKVGLATGLTLSASTLSTLLDGCQNRYDPGYQPKVLSSEENELLSTLVEIIIPTTDTPGAREAGVHQFIDTVLNSVMTDQQRETFLKGMERLDQQAQDGHRVNFIELSSTNQVALMQQLADENRDLEGDHFFKLLKQYTLLGYYTSEIGASQELIYLHVTGSYDGDVPYNEVGRAYS